MKKLALTLAIVLGLSMSTFAEGNHGGGLFLRGDEPTKEGEGGSNLPGLPGHGASGNQDAPVGTGIAIMTALGAAYLIGKRRKED